MKPTKSVMVYQEQIMRVFTDLGGFTKSEADTMRKIIGKKLGEDEFNKHRVKFVEGCASNDIEASIAESLMNDMAEFAAYSFNKSHAAAYSMISVWCMYCKVHYPAEFIAAYMSCVHGEESIVKAMAESKRQGVPVALPNINLSTDRYELDIETGAILAPLTCIKGVGTKAVNSILEARKDGVFFSKANMVERVNRRVVNIRVQDILTRAGAFESLGLREIDDVQRKKDQAELLPMFENVPQLTLAGNEPDLDQLAVVLAEARRYATTKHKDFIKPMVGGKRPSIMVISMPVKGEKNMLSKEGSRHLLNCLKRRGIPKSAVYGTSPAKTLYDPPSRTNKKCMAIGLEFLKKEIEVMRPKVIICCHAEPINLFVPGGKLAKLNGRVVYSKEHDAYVVFSYSPQFAFYQEERAGSLFNASMDKVAEMFIDRRI